MKSKIDKQVQDMKEGFFSQLLISGMYHLLEQPALFMQIQSSFYLPILFFVHLIKGQQGEMDQKQFFKTKTVSSPTLALMRN